MTKTMIVCLKKKSLTSIFLLEAIFSAFVKLYGEIVWRLSKLLEMDTLFGALKEEECCKMKTYCLIQSSFFTFRIKKMAREESRW